LDQELGSGWTAGVHPEDLARCLDTYVTAFDKRQPFTMEYRLRNFEGEYCWVTDAGIPRTFPDGTFLGYVGCCLDISDKKDAENARKDLANRLIHAQETERTRIARELHDDVGQQLAILRIEMMRAGEPVSGSPDKRHPSVTELCDSVKIIADKISHMSHQLHSSELEFLGLKVAVQSACRQSAERYGIKIECICDEVPAKIDGIVSLCLFRVVQEALHNVAKHSGAANIEVRLKAAPDELTLAVIDDGHGFDVEQARLATGLGLIGMRERIQLIGGHFEVSSEPGHGTRIRVRAPVISAAPVSGLSTFPT
jgi:signal transduction histidine kinase